MCPTVSIGVKADFGASGWGTSRGLLRGRWCSVGKQCVSCSKGRDACREGCNCSSEWCIGLGELIESRAFSSGGRGEASLLR